MTETWNPKSTYGWKARLGWWLEDAAFGLDKLALRLIRTERQRPLLRHYCHPDHPCSPTHMCPSCQSYAYPEDIR